MILFSRGPKIGLLFLILGVISCTNFENRKQLINKEFEQGIVLADTIITLFNKAELNKVTSAFKEVCKKNKMTPAMKLQGYAYVYNSFDRMKRYDSALMYVDSCIIAIEKNKLEQYLQGFYYEFLLHKSALLFRFRQPEKANEIFYRVKEEIDRINEVIPKFILFERLAFIAYQQKKFKEAAENFRKLIPLQNTIRPLDYYKKTEIVSNIGLSLFHEKLCDSALLMFKVARDTLNAHAHKVVPEINTQEANRNAYNHALGVLLGNIAKVFIIQQQYDSAITYSKMSIALNSGVQGEKYDAQQVVMRLIDVYIKTKKWKEAKLQLLQVQKTIDSLPDEIVRMNWNRQMAILMEIQNKPQQAFTFFKTYHIIKDSLSQLELIDAENDIIKDLQIRNQQQDLSLLYKDNQLKKLYLWISVGLIFFATLVILLVFRIYKKTKENNIVLEELNREIIRQKSQVEKALSIKDKVLNVVAHDLRNPLSGIAAVSKTILEDEEEEIPHKKMLQMIAQTSSNTLMLVDELLHNHTTEQLQLQQTTVAINSLINNACSLLQHKAIEKQQKLSIHLPSKESMLQIDAAKIERVITNIIGNAIKFTPLNGSIWVEASMLNDCYIIAVKDNGLGIDEQNIHHIFNPFNTARKSGTAGEKSFGFGLSICKQIIEAHQGKIWVESTVGKGSTFYIQLPLNNN